MSMALLIAYQRVWSAPIYQRHSDMQTSLAKALREQAAVFLDECCQRLQGLYLCPYRRRQVIVAQRSTGGFDVSYLKIQGAFPFSPFDWRLRLYQMKLAHYLLSPNQSEHETKMNLSRRTWLSQLQPWLYHASIVWNTSMHLWYYIRSNTLGKMSLLAPGVKVYTTSDKVWKLTKRFIVSISPDNGGGDRTLMASPSTHVNYLSAGQALESV